MLRLRYPVLLLNGVVDGYLMMLMLAISDLDTAPETSPAAINCLATGTT